MIRLLPFFIGTMLFATTPLFGEEDNPAKKVEGIGKLQVEMPERWHKLVDLIEDEIKTIKMVQVKMGPSLKYRLLELYSEKLTLIKEYENQVYLSTKEKRKKRTYFRKSLAEYKRIKKFGFSIMKKYPRFINNADIYYTLALNSRDFGHDNKIELYLKNSLRLAPRGAPIIHSAKVALAEHYYNKKKFSKAGRLYKDILKNKEDERLAKHHYNSGWCQLKMKRHNIAISQLHKAFYLGKKDEYTSVEEQILNALYIFHVHANRIKEAVDFYNKHLEDPSSYMIKMAKSTSDKGLFSDTRMVLREALKRVVKNNNYPAETNIRLAELDIYRNFKKNDLFFSTSKRLRELNELKSFSPEQHGEAVNKISSLVGYMQVRLSKNAKKNVKRYSTKKLNQIITYFDILVSIDQTNKDKYTYYQGETLFAVAKYYQSALKYQESINASKKKTKLDKEEQKLRKKAITSLLSTLDEAKGWSKKKRQDMTLFAFTNHVDLYPKDKVSREIYTRLFFLQKKLDDHKGAVVTVDKYEKSFPQDIKKQRELITSLIDQYIEKKEVAKINKWIDKLKTGYLNFKNDYIEKATIILGKILFEGYQKLEIKGNKEEAVEGYISLYENETYPAPIKAKAAFTIALLSLDLSDTEDSKEWFDKSLIHFEKEKFFNQRNKVLAIGEKMGMLQNFLAGEQIAENFLDKFCREKYKEEIQFFRLAFNYKLIQENEDAALNFFKKGQLCGIKEKTITKMKREMLTHLVRFNKYEKILTHYTQTKANTFLLKDHGNYQLDIYWKLVDQGNEKKATVFWNNLMDIEKNLIAGHPGHEKVKKKIDASRDFKRYYTEANKFMDRQISMQPKAFDDKKYNQELSTMMGELKKITDNMKPHLQTGMVEVTLGTYQVVVKAYEHLKNEILRFKINGVDADFKKGFNKQMRGIALKLGRQGKGFRTQGKKLILANDVFNDFNKDFLITDHKKKNLRHPASLYIVPIDHKGARR